MNGKRVTRIGKHRKRKLRKVKECGEEKNSSALGGGKKKKSLGERTPILADPARAFQVKTATEKGAIGGHNCGEETAILGIQAKRRGKAE